MLGFHRWLGISRGLKSNILILNPCFIWLRRISLDFKIIFILPILWDRFRGKMWPNHSWNLLCFPSILGRSLLLMDSLCSICQVTHQMLWRLCRFRLFFSSNCWWNTIQKSTGRLLGLSSQQIDRYPNFSSLRHSSLWVYFCKMNCRNPSA